MSFRFGVIIAFATNAYMQEGIDESPVTLRQGSTDIKQFLKSTGWEIDHILKTNFRFLETHIKQTLNGEFFVDIYFYGKLMISGPGLIFIEFHPN